MKVWYKPWAAEGDVRQGVWWQGVTRFKRG
jgi:hypothetical protein